jgi:hypothetical protein
MRRPGLSTRLTGAVLVVALHGLLIVGLLNMNLAPGVVRLVEQTPHQTELVLPLPPLPEKSTAPVKGPERNGAGTVVSPDTASPFFSPPATAGALGAALFGCTPENLRSLTREQQEKCLKLAGGRYALMKDGLPRSIKPPGPEWEGLRNSDLRARERGTADPCMAAKATGTECIHEILFGKKLW